MKQIFLSLTLLCLLAAGTLCGAPNANSAEEDPLAFLREERIGDLHIGMPEIEVKQKVTCPLKRGKAILEGATGEYVEEWSYPTCGLRLKMSSEHKKGPKAIAAISVASPSTLATKRGICVGSTEQEVIEAYRGSQDEDGVLHSRKGEQFVAGSVYGGLIFSFAKGRVSQIFLGAAAE